MSGSFTPLCVLLADDVRLERDNGISIMGVCTPRITAAELPMAQKMHFVMVVNATSPGRMTFKTQVRWLGDVKWAAEHDVVIAAEEFGGHVHIEGPIGLLDQSGSLVFEFGNGTEEPKPLMTWLVEAPPSTDDGSS